MSNEPWWPIQHWVHPSEQGDTRTSWSDHARVAVLQHNRQKVYVFDTRQFSDLEHSFLVSTHPYDKEHLSDVPCYSELELRCCLNEKFTSEGNNKGDDDAP